MRRDSSPGCRAGRVRAEANGSQKGPRCAAKLVADAVSCDQFTIFLPGIAYGSLSPRQFRGAKTSLRLMRNTSITTARSKNGRGSWKGRRRALLAALVSFKRGISRRGAGRLIGLAGNRRHFNEGSPERPHAQELERMGGRGGREIPARVARRVSNSWASHRVGRTV